MFQFSYNHYYEVNIHDLTGLSFSLGGGGRCLYYGLVCFVPFPLKALIVMVTHLKRPIAINLM